MSDWFFGYGTTIENGAMGVYLSQTIIQDFGVKNLTFGSGVQFIKGYMFRFETSAPVNGQINI